MNWKKTIKLGAGFGHNQMIGRKTQNTLNTLKFHRMPRRRADKLQKTCLWIYRIQKRMNATAPAAAAVVEKTEGVHLG